MQRIIALIGLGALIVLGVVFSKTTPSDIPPVGLLVVFVAMYLVVLSVASFGLYGGSYVFSRVLHRLNALSIRPLAFRSSYIYGSVLAIAPIMLIALQSVVEVKLLDVVLVVAFEGIACFYIWRRL